MSIAGDPASVSQSGATLRRLAEQLRRQARALHDVTSADQPRGGAALARARRRAARLADAAGVAARELDRVGTEAQGHSHELAEALATLRAVEDRAAGHGLAVSGGSLAPAWGVQGVADEDRTRDAEHHRAELQRRLDAAATMLARHRARLRKVVAESGDTLADEAEGLRR